MFEPIAMNAFSAKVASPVEAEPELVRRTAPTTPTATCGPAISTGLSTSPCHPSPRDANRPHSGPYSGKGSRLAFDLDADRAGEADRARFLHPHAHAEHALDSK